MKITTTGKNALLLTLIPKGMCVEFNKAINVDSTIHLVIIKSGESEPIITKGILKWIRQEKNDFIGGIELAETLDENTFAKLSLSLIEKEKNVNTQGSKYHGKQKKIWSI